MHNRAFHLISVVFGRKVKLRPYAIASSRKMEEAKRAILVNLLAELGPEQHRFSPEGHAGVSDHHDDGPGGEERLFGSSFYDTRT